MTDIRILLGLVLGAVAVTAGGATAPDTIEARAQGCSTCHGARGAGTDLNFPRIAGKPAGYLFNQLKNFRDGQRSYPPMNYLVAYMHDDYLTELAGYFAAQTVDLPGAASTPGPAAGQLLATQGDHAHGVPACVQCHGVRLTGIEPGIPGLIGLNGRYIAAQLVSWRVGTRHAKQPDCMHEVASHLDEAQIRAVAAWLAAQPAQYSLAPAAAGSWNTPVPCGSQP